MYFSSQSLHGTSYTTSLWLRAKERIPPENNNTVIIIIYLSLLSNCNNYVSRACLLAAASKHSGAWLNAPPVSSLGLRMCNKTIRIAVGLRMGAAICHSHSCEICGREADQLGHNGLSCRYSQGRLAQHNALNSIIHHALAAAKIPSFPPGAIWSTPLRWQMSQWCHHDPIQVRRHDPCLGRHLCRHLLRVPQAQMCL